MADNNTEKAYQGFIRQIIKVSFSKKIRNHPENIEKIAEIFDKAGGSWEKIFLGSPEEISFLKKVIKKATDKNLLEKKYEKPRDE